MPEHRRRLSIYNQSADSAVAVNSVKRWAAILGDLRGVAMRPVFTRRQIDCRGLAMLSIPTLWLVFVVNFAALALVWSYVARSYPNFGAARSWAAGACFACAGAALSMLRGSVDPLVAIALGGGLLIFSCWLRRHGRAAVLWPADILDALARRQRASARSGLVVFKLWRDDVAIRIFSSSLGAVDRPGAGAQDRAVAAAGPEQPGARLAAGVAVLGVAVHAVRSAAGLMQLGGNLCLLRFNGFQAAMVLALVFLSMVWNFGFLLMAIDRLRAEVAVLALVDDLTGIANRRHLLQRLAEECALSQRTRAPFALLAIDLDSFKDINDGFGHGAGDECLRLFTGAAQSRLRPGDMLARAGGDEFCIGAAATTLAEAAESRTPPARPAAKPSPAGKAPRSRSRLRSAWRNGRR